MRGLCLRRALEVYFAGVEHDLAGVGRDDEAAVVVDAARLTLATVPAHDLAAQDIARAPRLEHRIARLSQPEIERVEHGREHRLDTRIRTRGDRERGSRLPQLLGELLEQRADVQA